MNFSIPVKCSKRVEENGGFAMTLVLPPDVPGKDKILFTGARDITYFTRDREKAAEIKDGDTLFLSLYTADD